MEQITPTNKNKTKIIVLVIGLFIIAGVGLAFFVPSQEERIKNYKEEKRQEKIEEKLEQSEGEVLDGSVSGEDGASVMSQVLFHTAKTILLLQRKTLFMEQQVE